MPLEESSVEEKVFFNVQSSPKTKDTAEGKSGLLLCLFCIGDVVLTYKMSK